MTFLLCLGTTCEVVGYVFRALSAKKDPYRWNIGAGTAEALLSCLLCHALSSIWRPAPVWQHGMS